MHDAQALEEEYLTYSETLPYIPSIKELSLSKTSAQVLIDDEDDDDEDGDDEDGEDDDHVGDDGAFALHPKHQRHKLEQAMGPGNIALIRERWSDDQKDHVRRFLSRL